jgi:hypothetical protein
VRRRIIRIAHCHNASVDVRSQRIDCIEDRLRDAACHVDDHQHVARVNAMECSWVVVSRLATVGDELIVADVPLRVESDAAWQATLLVGVAHIAPKDRLDLGSRGGSGYDASLTRWMYVDPPEGQPRHGVGL